MNAGNQQKVSYRVYMPSVSLKIHSGKLPQELATWSINVEMNLGLRYSLAEKVADFLRY